MFTVFEFNNTDQSIKGKLEVYGNPDEPWFRGKQVAQLLGYKNTVDAVANHVKEKNKLSYDVLIQKIAPQENRDTKNMGIANHTPHFKKNDYDPQTIFINEPGLYSLIMRSKMPYAEEFQEWVTEDVLPTIRKTGKYDMKQNEPQKIPKIFYDLNKYINKSCLYILLVKENIYKFGITDDIKTRYKAQKKGLQFKEVVKIYQIDNFSICRIIENKVKFLVKQLGINVKIDTYCELFETSDEVKLDNIIYLVDFNNFFEL